MDDPVAFAAAALAQVADPRRAQNMAAYMKTDMPFYGATAPQRKAILKEMRRRFPIEDEEAWAATVVALWEQPHREERYLAIDVATRFPEYHTAANVPLFRRLIVEGAWWDLVDGVAAHCIGGALREERPEMRPLMDRWIDDPDLWVRRSALLAHLGHKDDTDQEQLFAHCLRRASEKEFFIRKAIGWVLRQYARTAPDEVAAFLLAHRDRWSGLTFREASKHLDL
ncbi:MAG: DNA alkylation repair protein [Acidimicrobiia bacterium]|jgi:3-methyladenine DNA glycosylase AlkD